MGNFLQKAHGFVSDGFGWFGWTVWVSWHHTASYNLGGRFWLGDLCRNVWKGYRLNGQLDFLADPHQKVITRPANIQFCLACMEGVPFTGVHSFPGRRHGAWAGFPFAGSSLQEYSRNDGPFCHVTGSTLEDENVAGCSGPPEVAYAECIIKLVREARV